MTLIKSISGIRGTIGGNKGINLTPYDIVDFTSAYYHYIKTNSSSKKLKIIVGRDARLSGEMVSKLVTATLISMGADVLDAGIATTPTIEMGVVFYNADGGIIITASHNPMQWNALKLLNSKGEFLNDNEGKEIVRLAEQSEFTFAEIAHIGKYSIVEDVLDKHIKAICDLDLVKIEAIQKASFKVVIDAVNSVGGIAVPKLLKALGVKEIIELYCEPNGVFPHNPEPLPENLSELSMTVNKNNADVGFCVDPDVDRLAIVDELGEMFGEEYTLVACADYVLRNKKGNTVSNLSSTQALRVVTEKFDCEYSSSAVGEVNVSQKMKETNAVIGGEGNGGIILPELHYGRDSLVGIALFLSHLATSGLKCSKLRNSFPDYFISKNKIEMPSDVNLTDILQKIKLKYSAYTIDETDGLKIHFDNEWIHLRRSNTEAIIRIYSESNLMEKADHLANKIIEDIKELLH